MFECTLKPIHGRLLQDFINIRISSPAAIAKARRVLDSPEMLKVTVRIVKQETSFKKIIVEGEYMWKNWFYVRTQNNWVHVWNNLNGGKLLEKSKEA